MPVTCRDWLKYGYFCFSKEIKTAFLDSLPFFAKIHWINNMPVNEIMSKSVRLSSLVLTTTEKNRAALPDTLSSTYNNWHLIRTDLLISFALQKKITIYIQKKRAYMSFMTMVHPCHNPPIAIIQRLNIYIHIHMYVAGGWHLLFKPNGNRVKLNFAIANRASICQMSILCS